MALVDKVVGVHVCLEEEDIDHAFGGALALGYHAHPRGTVDIDLNVFLPPTDAARVLAVLERIGVQSPPLVFDTSCRPPM